MLLRRARTGSVSARDELIERVVHYFESLAPRHHSSKLLPKVGNSDIVQASLVKAIEGFDKFDGESEAQWKAWLKVLLINEVRQTGRFYGRQKRDARREYSFETVSGEVGSDRHASPNVHLESGADSPESEVMQREQFGLLRDAIKDLPNDYALVVQLRQFERLTFPEIAEKLGKSPEATKKLWYRAIIKLQDALVMERSNAS